ncbi:MAG: hypothetical protein M3N26_12400, partial [Pseudomonadota bacterium]|nr:hypothetical protein [Pseudomonadota bacterium]
MNDISCADGTAFPAMTRQADQKYCFSCGKLLHVSAGACPSCGADQSHGPTGGTAAVSLSRTNLATVRPAAPGLSPAQSMFCYGCGAQIHQAAAACPACGAMQQGGPARAAGKD